VLWLWVFIRLWFIVRRFFLRGCMRIVGVLVICSFLVLLLSRWLDVCWKMNVFYLCGLIVWSGCREEVGFR